MQVGAAPCNNAVEMKLKPLQEKQLLDTLTSLKNRVSSTKQESSGKEKYKLSWLRV